jgi:selenocysteine-specific elongation factor
MTMKESQIFTIATAGHVDHGKTSLLKILTGIDTDRLKEEKERQMTTDLGFAHLKLPDDLYVGFIDVPGHGKFLKNMLAGVGGIDLALLVVAADEGPMPQTEQHVRILALLGVKRAVVALTKVDLVDSDRISTAKQRTISLLQEFGVDGSFAEVDSLSGRGLDELKSLLVKAIENVPAHDTTGGARFPIDRAFSKTGFGTVITGTLVRGRLRTGDEIYIHPLGTKGRIRRLEAFGKSADSAAAGQRLACNIALREDVNVTRGMVLTNSSAVAADNILVSLYFWPKDGIAADPGKLAGQAVRVYHGTAEVHGHLTWVTETSTCAIANISLEQKLIAEPGDRYILRTADDSIYGGVVVMKNRPRWMTRPIAAPFAELALEGKKQQQLEFYLQASPARLATDDQLLLFLHPSELNSLVPSGTKYGGFTAHAEYCSQLEGKVVALLHGLQGEELQGLQPNMNRQFFAAFLEQLGANGKIARSTDKYHAPGKPQQQQDEGSAIKLLNELKPHICIEIEELANTSGLPAQKIRSLLKALAQSGEAFVINYDFAAPADQVQNAHRILGQLWTEKREIAPGEFRARLGTSRKYAMALLAHFDDQQITRRMATGRILLKPPT